MKNKVLTIETDNIYVGDEVQWGKHRGYVIAVETDKIKIEWYDSRSILDLIPRKWFTPKRVFKVDHS